MAFTGFNDSTDSTALPDVFFRELLPQIDHAGELKLVVYLLWRIAKQERAFPFFRLSEIEADEVFMRGIGGDAALSDALDRAVGRGVLLPPGVSPDPVYMLNTPKGRAALRGLEQERWNPDAFSAQQVSLGEQRPNIFKLYEQNIGPLTPLIAESLREAEAQYPSDWIEDAIRISLENNVRKWRYVEAILKSWQEKGRNDRKDQQDSESDSRKYVEGEFSDFIER